MFVISQSVVHLINGFFKPMNEELSKVMAEVILATLHAAPAITPNTLMIGKISLKVILVTFVVYDDYAERAKLPKPELHLSQEQTQGLDQY